MGNHPDIGNPFKNANKAEFNARMNYNSTYTDIMLYQKSSLIFKYYLKSIYKAMGGNYPLSFMSF